MFTFAVQIQLDIFRLNSPAGVRVARRGSSSGGSSLMVADLLVHDAQYTAEELQKRRG